jgi:hypothetical protein
MIFFTASAAAMAGRPLDNRVVVRHPRLLRGLRNTIDIGTERDDGLTRAPRRHERGRYSRNPLLHGEPIGFQNVDQVTRRFEFLKPQLAIAEDLVHHPLNEFLARVDIRDGFFLQCVQPRIRVRRTVFRRLLLRERSRSDRQREERREDEGSTRGHQMEASV